jgi:hypothetical protein
MHETEARNWPLEPAGDELRFRVRDAHIQGQVIWCCSACGKSDAECVAMVKRTGQACCDDCGY